MLRAFLFLITALPCLAATQVLKTEANVPIEITLTTTKAHADPFNDVELDVIFTAPNGSKKIVPAFWDGSNIWKARYSSQIIGTHRWKSRCSNDGALNGIEGTISVSKYRGTNLLYRHGPIRVAPDHRHFEYADGMRFFWLGDTWWMGLCNRLHFPDEFGQLAADRKEKGFNVVQVVAGLYPDMHPFDPRGANEAGFPWETNYARIRPQYFDAADQRIGYLIEQGFTPCIVGAWGYFLPWMGEAKAKQHWRELIARYGSWPVVWCIAGEANLPWYLAKGFPYDDREQVHGWTSVTRYVRETDPFHRPITIHPTGIGKLNARWSIDDASFIDFDMLQTPHGQADAVAPTVAAFRHAYELRPAMPILDGEASYEMLNGTISAEWSRAMFWLCIMNGAPGHTYGANGIWQCNRRDQPHGASPHGGNYGTISWDDAMKLPGSQQIGDGKKFLEMFKWQKCKPQPQSVKWADESQTLSGSWIWFPEGDAHVDAPLAPRYFRRTIELATPVERATLRISADDKATVWVNGEKIGEAIDWRTPHDFDIGKLLKVGTNIVAICAENLPAPVKQNPAGLLAEIRVDSKNGNQTFVTDTHWRCSRDPAPNWYSTNFDDSAWTSAKVVAHYGDAPWGRLGQQDPSFVPYAIGKGEELRLVYSISPRPVQVSQLRPETDYRITEFDTITGTVMHSTRRTDKSGSIVYDAPTYHHDYVLALELH